MPETSDDDRIASDVVRAAREFIRREGHNSVVAIWGLLDELSEKFGDRFRVSPDMHKLLDLITKLWDDPHIDQPLPRWVEFTWNDNPQRRSTSFASLRALLLYNGRIQPETQEQQGP